MTKLFFRFYIAVAVALIVSLFTASVFVNDFYEKTLGSDYALMTRALNELLINDLNNADKSIHPEILKKYQNDYPFTITIKDVNHLSKNSRELLERNGLFVDVNTGYITEKISVYYPGPRADQAISFSSSTSFTEPYNLILVQLIVFILIGFAIALFIVVKPIRSHVNKLGAVATLIGRGEFTQRADEKAPTPLDDIAKSINRMAFHLKALMDEKKVIMGAAAHELRTPLARLRFAIDMTPGIQGEEELRVHVEAMEMDVEQLENLVEEILAFSKLSQASMQISAEPLIPKQVIEKTKDNLEPLRSDIGFSIDIPANLTINADRNGFIRATSNVMRNAQKYAESLVSVSAQKKNGYLVLSVEDDGQGLPVEEHPKILEAFYRSDASRNNESGGTGLGLAIVDKILQLHGGYVEIKSSNLGGLCVELHWLTV